MSKTVLELLGAIPTDFKHTPTGLEPKAENERVVGTLDGLAVQTQQLMRGRSYYSQLLFEKQAAHRKLHADPAYNGAACPAHHAEMDELEEALEQVSNAAVDRVYVELGINPETEVLGLRAEGIVAGPPAPPEPQVPDFIRELAEAMGGDVQVMGGPGGIVGIAIGGRPRDNG